MTLVVKIFVALVVMAIFAVILAGTSVLIDHILTRYQDKLDRCTGLWGKAWYGFLMGFSVLGCIFLSVAAGVGVVHMLIQFQQTTGLGL